MEPHEARLRGDRLRCARAQFPPRTFPRIQGEPSAHARRSARADRAASRNRREARLADSVRFGRGSRRRDRDVGKARRSPGPRRRHRHGRQGHGAACERQDRPSQHHEQQVLRPRGRNGEVRGLPRAHHRLPCAHGRQGRQRARNRKVRPEDGGEVDRRVRFARRRRRTRARSEGKDRRKPPRGVALPRRRPRARHDQVRLRGAGRRGRPRTPCEARRSGGDRRLCAPLGNVGVDPQPRGPGRSLL